MTATTTAVRAYTVAGEDATLYLCASCAELFLPLDDPAYTVTVAPSEALACEVCDAQAALWQDWDAARAHEAWQREQAARPWPSAHDREEPF